MDIKQINTEKVKNLFFALINTKLEFITRVASARPLAEAIIDYLHEVHMGVDEHLIYDAVEPRNKSKKHQFPIRVAILNHFNKFPKRLNGAIIFIQKQTSGILHNDVYAKDQYGEITYIDLVVLSSFPIVKWFLYDELKCHPNELKIDEAILDYKKNHLNYSEKIVYDNNFDMEKIIEEIKKQNVVINNDISPVITNNVSPITKIIINNDGVKIGETIPFKYLLIMIGVICLTALMFKIYKLNDTTSKLSESRVSTSSSSPSAKDSIPNSGGVSITNIGNEVQSTVYGNIEENNEDKK